jgi:predicted GNAT family acetyltransferase
MATAPDAQGRTGRVVVRPLRRRDRDAALAHLRGRARDDLFLIDLVRQIGAGALADASTEVLGAWRGSELVALASLRPTVVLETGIERSVLDSLVGPLSDLGTGLVRSEFGGVAPLWARLVARGRRALVDRRETSLVLESDALRVAPPPAGVAIRAAGEGDLEALIDAARASLREEGRPDPFIGDPRGFRRWVSARLSRARIAESAGEVVWVGYADVQLEEGWLLQGIYTWPAWRRRGIARAGVTALCQNAFGARAEHVQLSVVEGNGPALGLYESLGFRVHGTLRTLLFI